ncbi:MAG: rhodanese-like domain-containing protein [Thermoplasmatota archaeon]
MSATLIARHSSVLETPAAEPAEARSHFAAKLAHETDPSDVNADLSKGLTGFVVVDCRSPESYAKGHVAGALSLPYRTIDAETAGRLPKDKTIVTYCSSLTCNASTKGALRLSELGFRVKEMVGGFEAWTKKGYPVAAGTAAGEFNAQLVRA